MGRRPVNPDWEAAHPRAEWDPPPPPPSEATLEAQKGIVDWAGTKKKSKRKLAAPARDRRVGLRQEALEILISGRWVDALPDHFVELYVYLHTKVYGVEPTEMSGKDWPLAKTAAARMLTKEFNGEQVRMADFFRWVWSMQERDEKRRKAGSKDDDFRVTWRYQFSSKLLTQWRVAVARGRA